MSISERRDLDSVFNVGRVFADPDLWTEEHRRAALLICSEAESATEARRLLEAVGLLAYNSTTNTTEGS